MSTETFVNYWIGQEPNPPSPTLNQMPAYVDVAPLAFVGIDDDFQLDFGFLTQHFEASLIQQWIGEVRANDTKVLLSIIGDKLGQVPDVDAFVNSVAEAAAEWGVDGIDLDFEPPYESQTLVEIATGLRPALEKTLGRAPLLTAPVYGAWLGMLDFLKSFADQLDLVTTMDYTPWPGVSEMQSLFGQYATAIGSPEKLAVGLSCMGPPPPASYNFTPLDDVKTMTAWEPEGGTKGGVMLYTFSYDVETRAAGGTGYPDGTWTQTIHDLLP